MLGRGFYLPALGGPFQQGGLRWAPGPSLRVAAFELFHGCAQAELAEGQGDW